MKPGSRMVWLALLVLIAGIATILWWFGSRPSADRPAAPIDGPPLRSLGELYQEGFARVRDRWEFRFPEDHGPHPDYRTEWWYLTGVLTRRAPPPLGFQLVLARLALTPQPPQRASAWAASEVYLGLLTLSNPQAGRPFASLQTSRAALGLAGAKTDPIKVWLGGWRLQHRSGEDSDSPGWRLNATTDTYEVDLLLRSTKVPALTSDLRGRAGALAPPFHLYVQPRLEVQGTLRIADDAWPIDGHLSLEHAWGELPLPGGPVARDRFVLYLDDGRELFCIRTHRVDGSGKPDNSCLLIGPSGSGQALSGAALKLDPVEYWSNPGSRVRYPLSWALRAPEHNLDLRLTPVSQSEEVNLWAPTWAGPLRLRGTSDKGPVAGAGFMQLTGYHDL